MQQEYEVEEGAIAPAPAPAPEFAPGQSGRTASERDAASFAANSFGNTLGFIVDSMVATHRLHGVADAAEAEFVDQIRAFCEREAVPIPNDAYKTWDQKRTARRTAVTEVAAALRLPELTAETLIEVSKLLVHEYTETLDALRAGEISYRHVTVIADNAWSLDDDDRPAYETAVLPHAKRLSVAKFKRKAHATRERMAPETIVYRHEKSVRDRAIDFTAQRDGMATLTLYFDAATARAIWNRATAIARSQESPDDPRTLTQRRADAVAELLVSGEAPDLPQGVRAEVSLLVPALTLLGRSGEPAMLEGYGPIDPDTARRLAVNAPSFTRILTHPETGVMLSLGRDRYRVPEDLKRYVRLRDEYCRFGDDCGTAARHSEIDHTQDFGYGGETEAGNLASLCGKHHGDKHNTGWRVRQLGGGVLEWTSPSGHIYIDEPERFHGP